MIIKSGITAWAVAGSGTHVEALEGCLAQGVIWRDAPH